MKILLYEFYGIFLDFILFFRYFSDLFPYYFWVYIFAQDL